MTKRHSRSRSVRGPRRSNRSRRDQRRASRRRVRRSNLLFEALESRTLLANDLVGFAELLTLNDVKLYGAGWCHNCVDQKELFEDGAQFLQDIDLFDADGTRNAIRPDLTSIPVWEFPDGSGGVNQVTGKLTLDQISAESGIAIPQSDDPWVKPIGELVQVLSGSPLHVPLDGYDPNGDPLDYTVTVTDVNGNATSLVTGEVLEGNRSMRVNIVSQAGGFTMNMGELVFELFEQRAPRPTERLAQLTESGHYDDSYYHRLEHGFVLQGGGQTPTQGGGSTLGNFDDQFHVDLQHNRDGILSYAKAGDDTNDAQYFVTLAPSRFLDFNHSVAGQLVEGSDVLTAIEAEPVVDMGGFNSPEFAKQIGVLAAFAGTKEPTEIFTDTENAVVMLKADQAAVGQEFTITVTAEDTANNQTTMSFDVIVADDTPENGGANGGPFLEDIGEFVTTPSTPVEIPLSAVDVEGDPVFYDAAATGNVNYQLDVDNDTGLVTVTPPDGFVGEFEVLVAVRALNGSNTADTWDQQVVTIDVVLGAPSIDLLPSSDSNIPDDNVTNITEVVVNVSNAAHNATVEVLDGDTVVGTGQANSDVEITTDALGEGVRTLTARQTLGGVTSDRSAALQITVDTIEPTFTTTPPDKGTKGVELVYDANTDDNGATYSLISPPTGATISSSTGVLTWTPQQAGTHNFQIKTTDLAGNETIQDVNIEAIEPKVRVTLLTTDAQGNPIQRIQKGADYLLRVLVKDIRQPPMAEGGVFSNYLNISYDASLVTPNAAGPDEIIFADEYTWLPSGDFGTPGEITDVGSAASPDPNFPSLFPPFGPANMVQLSIPMTATEEGTAEFFATPSDDELLPIAVYVSEGAVLPDEVVILGTSLVIGEGLIAHDDLFNVDEDSSDNVLDVINNPGGEDENPQGGAITIISVGATSDGGDVSIVNGQRLDYAPKANFFGEEEFTYTISNGQSTSTATVTVQVQPQNDDPTAVDDTYTVAQGSQSVFLDVLNNDIFAPDQNESLRVSAVVAPSQDGTVTIAPNGTHLEYTPKPGFAGQETINYTISDGNGGTANAIVTVTVEEGTRPTAGDDEATVDEDSPATAIDVLANDSAADGGQLTVVSVTQPLTGGNVTRAADGSNVSYTPAPNFFGTDTFTYTVAEAGGGQSTATVTVTIDGQNDPPIANDDELNVTKNSDDNRLNVLANDSDLPDAGETLTVTDVTLVSADQGSVISVSTDGQAIEYTPASDLTGTETVTYTINDRPDGSGLTHQATVTINVVESTISGRVIAAGSQAPVRGLQLSLTLADGQGAPGDDSPHTGTDGSFQAPAIPGLYTLEADPPFLAAIKEEVQVDSGGNVTVDVPIVREAVHMRIADFLATAPDRSSRSPDDSILAAVTPGGVAAGAGEGEDGTSGEQHWYTIETGWAGYTDVQVQVSQDLSQVTLTATATNGNRYQTTISADDGAVEFMGSEGDARLIRITVDPAALDWQLLTDNTGGESCSEDSTSCSIEAEGEAAEPTVVVPIEVAPATTPINVTPPVIEQPTAPPVVDVIAEGEASGAVSIAVATPVVALAEPAPDIATEPVIVETVPASPEPLNPETAPIPGIGAADGESHSTLARSDPESTPLIDFVATDAIDAAIVDPPLDEEESDERDLVLVGSQSGADEYALAVDWLLSDGLE